MKKSKSQQLRVRITEDQLKRLTEYIIDNPKEFNSKSDLIRTLVEKKICRDRRGNQSSINGEKNTPTS